MLYPFELRALNDLRLPVSVVFTNFSFIAGSALTAATSTLCMALVRSSVDTILYRSKTDLIL